MTAICKLALYAHTKINYISQFHIERERKNKKERKNGVNPSNFLGRA